MENYADIMIKECDFNPELGIDWYHNYSDLDYIVMREYIQKVCQERQKHRKEHNNKLKQSLVNLWRETRMEFAELWRHNFMNKCKPKFVNLKQPTFEIYVEKIMDEQRVIIERQCKHEIVDKNGDLITRTTLGFSERLCGGLGDNYGDNYAERKYDDNAAGAVRVRNKTVQLLKDIAPVVIDDGKDDEKEETQRHIVWVPFKEIECYNCGCNEARNLRIFQFMHHMRTIHYTIK